MPMEWREDGLHAWIASLPAVLESHVLADHWRDVDEALALPWWSPFPPPGEAPNPFGPSDLWGTQYGRWWLLAWLRRRGAVRVSVDGEDLGYEELVGRARDEPSGVVEDAASPARFSSLWVEAEELLRRLTLHLAAQRSVNRP